MRANRADAMGIHPIDSIALRKKMVRLAPATSESPGYDRSKPVAGPCRRSKTLAMLSDIPSTGFECGVPNGNVQSSNTSILNRGPRFILEKKGSTQGMTPTINPNTKSSSAAVKPMK
jgi:hypothetical protein